MIINKELNETRIINRSIVVAYALLALILIGAYVVEVIKGSRTWQYLVSFSLLFIIPGVINGVIQYRNPDNKWTKFILPLGYLFICGFVLATGVTYGVYVYSIPMLIGFTLMHNWVYTSLYASAIVVMNIVFVALGGNKAGMVDTEIQLAAIIMVCLYSGMTCYVDTQMTKKKMNDIETAVNDNNAMVEKITGTASQVITSTKDLSAKIDSLYKSTTDTTNAMSEVCSGTNQTAQSIQEELTQIDAMARGIDQIEVSLNAFTDSLQDTMLSIKSGVENISNLQQSSSETASTTKNTVEAIENLAKKIDAIKQVVGLIAEISDQTNLLSLNASIEAARAGDAGRGFAVVADEIRVLSEQTNSSLERIKDEIEGVTAGSNCVTKDMGILTEIFTKQNDLISKTSKVFGAINESSELMTDKYKEVAENINSVKRGKDLVLSNIETVSAVTEQVTANASSTMGVSKANLDLLKGVSQEVAELASSIESLTK